MKKTILLAGLLTGAATFGHAAAFTAGDLVIYRVGDGTATGLSTAGSAVFLDEYNPAGTLVQSVAVDSTTASGALVASGTASSEGLLTLSPDGQYLAIAGYNRPVGGTGSLSSTTATAVNRIVDVYNSTGAVASTTRLTDFASGNNPRTALTADGNTIYVGGGAGGLRVTTAGSTTSTQINTSANVRGVNIAGGQLYFSTSSGTTGIYTFGAGLPNAGSTPGQSMIAASASPFQFALADLSPAVAGPDTLYVADDTGTTGGIEKFSLVGGTWTANGTIVGTGIRGLTLSVGTNGSVNLFATTGGATATGGGTLYGLTDASGYNATITGTLNTLATAAANEAFRGIAFAPVAVPEPSACVSVLGACAGLAAMLRRRGGRTRL